jgi:hypothetical protein
MSVLATAPAPWCTQPGSCWAFGAGDRWETVAEVRGNTTGHVSSTFEPVTTEAVRILIRSSNDATYSRVVELEIYDG